MSIFFIVQRGPEIGRRYELQNAVITIGRSEDNDISFDDPYMSRYHAVIKQAGSKLVIIDLGSENAVQVRDTALEPGEPYILQNRDILRLGQNILCYVDSSQLPVRPAPPARDNTRIAPNPGPLSAPPPPAEEYAANWQLSSVPSSPPYPPLPPNPTDANYARMMNPSGIPPLSVEDDAAPTLPPLRPIGKATVYEPGSSQPSWQANYPPAANFSNADEDATMVEKMSSPPYSDSEATQLASYNLPATARPEPSQAQNLPVEPEVDPGDAPTTIIRLDKNKI